MARKKIKMTRRHHLPDEIITWILVKLPVKTLIRFQCICKHWKNLIKTPYFITQQLQHSKNITYRTVFPGDIIQDPLNSFMRDCEMRALPDVLKPPSMRNLRRHASFIGGCNGLICVLSPSYASLGTSHLFLWNPSTREVRQLPGVVNGKRGAHYLGFGFDPIANDYKIVKVLKSRRVIKHVEVYSLKTDSWRKIEFGDTLKGVENFYSSAYVNGSIVWCVLKSGEEKYGLILFDTAMEVFTHMPMPMPMPDFEIRFFGFKVCMLPRKLILFCYLLGKFYFWSMKEGVYAYGAKNWRWKYVGSIRPSRIPSSKSSILWKLRNHYHTYAVIVVVRSLVPVINIQRDDVSLT